MNFKPLNLIILFQVFSIFGCAQSQDIKLLSDSILLSWLEVYKVPAVGIGIIQNGKIKATKVLGSLTKDHPAPLNALFQVASLTKPIVEITTLILVNKNQWTLDEPLYHYWIDPDVSSDSTYKKLTTRHVLTHQSGFVNWRWLHPSGKLTFDFQPGTMTQYSGEGLEYLKRALEIKFKKPLEEIVKHNLFISYNMKDTRFFWDKDMDETRYAVPHNKEGVPYEIRKNKEASAADLLITTIADYTRFGTEVLKKKNISDAVWNDMIKIQAPEQKSRFGLGWEIFPELNNSEYALVHSGSDPGVRTIIILLPKTQRGLVIFTNGDQGMQIILKIISNSLNIGDQLIKMAN